MLIADIITVIVSSVFLVPAAVILSLLLIGTVGAEITDWRRFRSDGRAIEANRQAARAAWAKR